jgi:hypothetical protein
MFVGRVNEIDLIAGQLAAPRGPQTASILALYGLFGAGKTTLLRKIRSIISDRHLADAIFVTNEDITATTLPEFVFQLAGGFQSVNPDLTRFSIDETEGRRRRYLQIIGRLGADVMPMLQQLRSARAHTNGTAADYGERQLEADMLSLEIAIKHQFNNPDDQRLTLDSGNVMSEALIVDMMNTFFPLPPGEGLLDSYLSNGIAPKKVVIIIDTFEKITPLLNPWLLESFLPYLYQKRFGDFQCYRTSFLPEGTHVRDFFDVRVIIAGRERLSLTDQERRWDRYRDTMQEMRLGPFSREELAQYLTLSGIESNGKLDRIYEMTQGLPYLVSLWVDASKAEANGAERAFVNSLAEQRIFWYKTPEQREWIRSAAFLDWFDADALQCFTPVGNQAARAFEYLRNTSEVARPSRSKPGKFELHEIIRSALRESTLQESGDRALAYRESAASFYDAYDLLALFEPKERQLLRRLAYFARFDDQAITEYFGGEAHMVRDLIARAEDLFETNQKMTWLKPEPSRKLKRYNRCADSDSYQNFVEEVRKLWTWRRDQLLGEIETRRSAIEQAEEQLRQASSEHRMRLDLQGRAHHDLNALQADLHVAKKRWSRRLSARDALVARTSIFLTVLFFAMVFVSELIPVDQPTQMLIRTASFALMLLFLAISAGMLGRILYMRSRRQDHQALREDVISIENRLLQKQYEFHDLAARASKTDAESRSLDARIAELKREIQERLGQLDEPYV